MAGGRVEIKVYTHAKVFPFFSLPFGGGVIDLSCVCVYTIFVWYTVQKKGEGKKITFRSFKTFLFRWLCFFFSRIFCRRDKKKNQLNFFSVYPALQKIKTLATTTIFTPFVLIFILFDCISLVLVPP